VLIFLSQAHKMNKYKMYMSNKLQIEYNYLSRILEQMFQKKWLHKVYGQTSNKVFYELTPIGEAELERAKDRLIS